MASAAAALPQSAQHIPGATPAPAPAPAPATATAAAPPSASLNLHPASEATAELRRRTTQKHGSSSTSVDECPADDESDDKEKHTDADTDDKLNVEVNWGKTPSGEGTSAVCLKHRPKEKRVLTPAGRVTAPPMQSSASPRHTRSCTQ